MPGGFNWSRFGREAVWFASQALAYGVGFYLVWTVNIAKLLEAHRDGEAKTNLVLLLLVPFLVSASKRRQGWVKHWLLVWIAACLCICYYNSLNGVSDGRDTKLEQKQDASVQIGEWETAIESLKAQDAKIPEHKPITEQQYNDAKEKRDRTAQLRDRECDPAFIKAQRDKTSAQDVCNGDRERAQTAQDDFDDASVRWGYEQAHTNYTTQIAQARAKKEELGPKPTALDPAADMISRILTWSIISADWISSFIPLLLALLADLAYALGSSIVTQEMHISLTEAWGEDWRQKNFWQPKIKPRMKVEPSTLETVLETVQPEPSTLQDPDPEKVPPVLLAAPAEKALRPRKESVSEWRFERLSNRPNGSIPAGEAYEWYKSYCAEIGETPVSQKIFGTVMRGLAPGGKKEGSYPAYLGLAPKLALAASA